METPNVEATPVTPAETKVEFSPEQQAKVEAIVHEVSGRVASDLRADVKRLTRELEAAKAATPTTPDLSKDLDLTRAELAALKAEQSTARLDAQLRAAAGDLFLDTELATRVMKDSIKVGADGKITVVDADGNVAMDAEFKPLTLAGLAQRVADQKTFLARGQVKPGAGSVLAQGGARSTTAVKLTDLFGPRSNGAAANALGMRSPADYKRLRARAVSEGILPR